MRESEQGHAGPITPRAGALPGSATNFMLLDEFRQDDVFGYDTVRVHSQGSVSTVGPFVHVYFLNEGFDQEFVSDFTLALKNLRGRITGS